MNTPAFILPETGKPLAVHPAADCFPFIDGLAYTEFKGNIQASGQIEPLKICARTFLLLDGRNRLRACLELGIQPKYELVDIADPYGYIIGANITRRHMDDRQRAAIAVELATLEKGSNRFQGKVDDENHHLQKPLGQVEAAKALGISRNQLLHAKQIKQKDQEAHEAAKQGGNAALRELRAKRAEERKAELAAKFQELDDLKRQIKDNQAANRDDQLNNPSRRRMEFGIKISTHIKQINLFISQQIKTDNPPFNKADIPGLIDDLKTLTAQMESYYAPID
jgi:hypothetical protein